MPAIWRTTLCFEQADYSWSETYHWKVIDAPLADVVGNLNFLAAIRINLCGGTTNLAASPRITYMRVSDDNTLRDAYVSKEWARQKSAHSGPADYPVDPFAALVVRGDVASKLRRKIWYVSSLPSRVYNNRDGLFAQSNADWVQDWNIFVNGIKANYGLFHQAVDNPAYPLVPIKEMIQSGDRVELDGVAYPAGGDRLILRRGDYLEGSPKLQGTFYTIPSESGNAVVIVPGLKAHIQYVGRATAQLEHYVMDPLTAMTPVKKTHHKRGALVGLVHHGRSKKKRPAITSILAV